MPIESFRPKTLYDELGADKFRDLINELLPTEFVGCAFIPFPSRGKDGGIDSKTIGSQRKQIIFQYKWREVAAYLPAKLQNDIKSHFQNWVSEMSKKHSSGEYIFITNVPLTATTHQFFQIVITTYKKLSIQYWEFEKLNDLLNKNDRLYDKYFPLYTRGVVYKLQNRLKKTRLAGKPKRKITAKEIDTTKNKLQQLFIDQNLKYKYYYPFINLLEPLYLDKRGEVDRNKLRLLFAISQRQERQFIQKLKREGLINIVGSACITTNAKRAADLQNKMINQGSITLTDILTIFQ